MRFLATQIASTALLLAMCSSALLAQQNVSNPRQPTRQSINFHRQLQQKTVANRYRSSQLQSGPSQIKARVMPTQQPTLDRLQIKQQLAVAKQRYAARFNSRNGGGTIIRIDRQRTEQRRFFEQEVARLQQYNHDLMMMENRLENKFRNR